MHRLSPMALAQPQLNVVHVVLQAPNTLPRDPAQDDRFIAAVRRAFPNIVSRQLLPPEAPSQLPHLTLAGSSSQLALSAIQADFEVRFYGEYLRDVARGLEYAEEKIGTMLAGYQAMGVSPSMIGLIGTLRFSLGESNEDAVRHILETHLKSSVDPAETQDAQVKIAVKVREKYFVNLTLNNYEARKLERPIMPGMTEVRIRPWEGEVDDVGLELTVDINNNLEARVAGENPEVTEDGVRSVVGLMREVATSVGPEFAESGVLLRDALETGSRT